LEASVLDRPRRQRRKRLTDTMVKELRRKPRAYVVGDPELPAHNIRVLPNGPPHTFTVITRDPWGKQRWVAIGSSAEMTIEQARESARAVIKRVREGLEPFQPPPVKPDSVRDAVDNFFKRHVEAKRLLTADEMRRLADKHILPVWGERPFVDIGRSDIARLLDAIEDGEKKKPGSKWVADSVLLLLSSISRWHATRTDDYVPPFTRGMRRVPVQARKRDRLLNDDELRAVWTAAEAGGSFGALVRMLILCGQRLGKVSTMRWDDVVSGIWSISKESVREKGTAGELRLPKQALAILAAQPRILNNPHVFAGRRDRPMNGFTALKKAFDQRSGVSGYSLHDLRRLHRSLASRAQIAPHISERVLGHAQPGVAGVYDRHQYADEKAEAVQRVANLIEQIVNGEPGGANVVPMRPPR
jgi:integrase